MRQKRLITFVLFICSLLLWKPLHTEAAEQTVANLVLMVNFQNDATNVFTAGYQCVEEMYNTSDANGVRSYISAISDGKVDVQNFFPQDHQGSFHAITLSGSAEAYAQSDDTGFIEAVINEMNRMIESGELGEIQGDSLDTWEKAGQTLDGCIDNVTFLVQSDGNGTFYPHAAGYGGSRELYGKKVAQYNIIPTAKLSLSASYCLGYAVVSHEFLHSLGAPDLYRTGGVTDGKPVGIWDGWIISGL